jgi:thiamine kinase-like enzyme
MRFSPVSPKYLANSYTALSLDEPCLLHGDIGEHNTVIGHHMLHLIDWEFTSVTSPVMEFPRLFARPGFESQRREAFFAGYTEENGVPVPRRWQKQIDVLRVMVMVELTLWAQSAIDDLAKERNVHFLDAADTRFLRRQLMRVVEADDWLRARGINANIGVS